MTPPGKPVRQGRRAVVFTIIALWILFLGGLALWTANPVTLNQGQLQLARRTGAVVTAQVIDPAKERVRIDEVLAVAPLAAHKPAAGDELVVHDLAQSKPAKGEHILLPLVPEPNDQLFTVAPVWGGAGRGYPATPPVIEEAKKMLAER